MTITYPEHFPDEGLACREHEWHFHHQRPGFELCWQCGEERDYGQERVDDVLARQERDRDRWWRRGVRG